MSCPTLDQIKYYRARMLEVQDFTKNVMLPDLLAVAPFYLDLATTGKGVGNYLTWGVLDGASQNPNDRVFPAGGIANGAAQGLRRRHGQHAHLREVLLLRRLGGRGQDPARVVPGAGQVQPRGLPPIDERRRSPRASTTGPARRATSTTARCSRWRSARWPRCSSPTCAASQEVVAIVDQVLAAVGATGHPEVLQSNLGRIAARVIKARDQRRPRPRMGRPARGQHQEGRHRRATRLRRIRRRASAPAAGTLRAARSPTTSRSRTV